MSLFQIHKADNVATALNDILPGETVVLGDVVTDKIVVKEEIKRGHKVALYPIKAEEDIIKYGVRIGRAGCEIEAGYWVHLHNMHSVYDERSSHLDVHTGAPKDMKYE